MADNVNYSPAGSTSIATDDVSGVHYQYVKLADGAADSSAKIGGDATNGLDVDVTRLPALVAGTANIGDVDVLTVPAPLSTTGGGTEATAHRVTIANDSTGVLSVDDNGGALTVDNGGTFAVQVDGSALTALQLIDDPVKADDAGFTVGTDKVMMSGGIAVAHGSAPDAADANDAGGFLMNRHRVQFIIGGHPNIVTTRYNTTGSQTDTIVGPTNSAGTKMAVTQIQITADNANTASPAVSVGFGTANTPTGDGVVVSHPGLPGGGGVSRGDGSGLLGIGADGAELRITCGAPTGGSLTVVVSYFLIES